MINYHNFRGKTRKRDFENNNTIQLEVVFITHAYKITHRLSTLSLNWSSMTSESKL